MSIFGSRGVFYYDVRLNGRAEQQTDCSISRHNYIYSNTTLLPLDYLSVTDIAPSSGSTVKSSTYGRFLTTERTGLMVKSHIHAIAMGSIRFRHVLI